MKRIWRGVLVTAAAGLTSLPVIAQGEPPKGRLVVEPARVQIADIEPGSRWLLMAFGRELLPDVTVRGYFRWHDLKDDLRAGRVELDLKEKQTPPLAVWAAFDVATGGLLMAGPEGGTLSRAARVLAARQNPTLSDLSANEALLFVLRRGEGGWVWTGEAESFPSGRGSLLEWKPEPENFIPVSEDATAALLEFRPDDLFLAIDQRSLAVTVSRVP